MGDYRNSALLVTGAGGQLGRLAVAELLESGATKIIAGTRDPAALSDLTSRGVEVRQLDFDDVASLPKAFAGVERMLLISTVAPNRRDQQTRAVAAAQHAGVRFIAYTSAPNARPNADAGGIADHYWTEQAIAATGLDFAMLRNHIYTDMIPISAEHALATGQMFDATQGRGRSYVTRADTARVAAGALLSADGQGIYDVAGPEPETQEELAQLLRTRSGKPLQRVGVTPEQLRQGMMAAGLPSFMIDLLVAFDVDAAHGHHAIVNDVVERFTGRSPQKVADFLAQQRS